MMDVSALAEYLKEITGATPRFEDVDPAVTLKFPLFLKTGYSLQSVNLFNRNVLLALENKRKESPTPKSYAKQFDQLRKLVDGNLALVIDDLPAFARNRLLRMGVPFIVPGRQMFLPFIAMDLREHFPRNEPVSDKLTAPAQAVLLYHLQKMNLEHISLREIATRLNYSAMTLSKVAHEFKRTELCRLESSGRSLRLHFSSGNKRELWSQALPFLRSPVQAKHWVRWNSKPERMLIAGMTALSHATMIQDDSIPTFAMNEKGFHRGLKSERVIRCEEPEEAMGVIEAWSYEPGVLADGEHVDRLSLYLSLKDTEDERVHMALKDYWEAAPW